MSGCCLDLEAKQNIFSFVGVVVIFKINVYISKGGHFYLKL